MRIMKQESCYGTSFHVRRGGLPDLDALRSLVLDASASQWPCMLGGAAQDPDLILVIGPLEPKQRDEFLRRWSQHLYESSPTTRPSLLTARAA